MVVIFIVVIHGHSYASVPLAPLVAWSTVLVGAPTCVVIAQGHERGTMVSLMGHDQLAGRVFSELVEELIHNNAHVPLAMHNATIATHQGLQLLVMELLHFSLRWTLWTTYQARLALRSDSVERSNGFSAYSIELTQLCGAFGRWFTKQGWGIVETGGTPEPHMAEVLGS